MEHRHYGWMALCTALGLIVFAGHVQAESHGDDPALEDAVAYAGRWATEPALCARDEEEDQAITLGPSHFEGGGASCDMEVAEEGDNVWEAQLDCPADDMATDERIRMSLEAGDEAEDDVLTLTYLDREDFEVTLMRCPGPGE
ncbi:hypothetical protein [Billgrantia desiderata]|uniref:DUF3617 family protein n=1 Tax=Billgrantia desiderata TaxID=52021 RepID=A0AAW4YU02_9GAMM|nr:hypothetical protein [Halomonas desiderata]MCE8010680.1 hypothetical protein [Halomonas desiderata]MCE8029053.1 hypothetical protein [Halomonas desiderata]MCE8042023.1 hypothetical protein [Halomonas desiderata]MCE8046832.1 hypothetical protein [Halomonas desiderata]MCE8051889.1 hypothetical protein [Halomonas desiderata]